MAFAVWRQPCLDPSPPPEANSSQRLTVSNRIIIGVDFHPEFQQTACLDCETEELQEKRLAHLPRRRSSIVLWRLQVRRCVWVWTQQDQVAKKVRGAVERIEWALREVLSGQ